jgi:hypothetical protein
MGTCVAPDIPIAPGIVAGASRLLKPGVLVGGVIENEFDDDANVVAIAVEKGADVELVDNGVLVPEIVPCNAKGQLLCVSGSAATRDAADGIDRAARAMGKVNGPEHSKIPWFFGKSSTQEGVILCEMAVDGQREMPAWKRMKPLRPRSLS